MYTLKTILYAYMAKSDQIYHTWTCMQGKNLKSIINSSAERKLNESVHKCVQVCCANGEGQYSLLQPCWLLAEDIKCVFYEQLDIIIVCNCFHAPLDVFVCNCFHAPLDVFVCDCFHALFNMLFCRRSKFQWKVRMQSECFDSSI